MTIRVSGAMKVMEPSSSRLTEVAGVPPAVPQSLLVERLPVVIPVGHDGTSGDDLAGLAAGDLGAAGVHDADLRERRRAATRTGGADAECVEREHARHLGLPVPGRMAPPRAAVHLHHRVPRLVASERAKAREVVATGAVDLHDLSGGRPDHEAVGAPLGLDDAAELLGVHPPRHDVRAPHAKGREGRHERRHVEHRARVQVDRVLGDLLDERHHHVLRQDGVVGELRSVGRTAEGTRVQLEHRPRRIDRLAGVVLRAARQQLLVGVVALDPVVLEPAGGAGPPPPRLGHGGADLLVLPQDHPWGGVVEQRAELLSALTPVRGAEDGPELGAGQQRLEDAVTVLAQPQHAIPPLDTDRLERVRQPVRSHVELGIREAVAGAHERRAPRPAPSVLAEDVGQCDVVNEVQRPLLLASGPIGARRRQLDGSASSNRRSSGLITLPVALRGSSLTKNHWRGAL